MTSTKTRNVQTIAALTALTVVAIAILQVSYAAFSGTTLAEGNEFDAATVALSNDGFGSETLAMSNMVPGNTDQECIVVTYDGTVASDVKLYGSTTSTAADLGQYLDLKIDEVVIGAEENCADATTVVNIFDGTLSVNAGSFDLTHSDWSDGLASAWAPDTQNDTQTYRITVTLQDDNDAQGLDTEATFTWEAQNS